MVKSLVFIYNPKAGKTKNKEFESSISKLIPEGVQTKFLHIDSLHELNAENQFDVYIAIGGDGTVNSVAKLCLSQQKTLGIIPRGSGDGFARHRNVPYPLEKAIKVILEGNSIRVDTAEVANHFFLNLAGVGFEADVAHHFSTLKKRGLWGYTKAILKLFIGTANSEYEISFEGSRTKIKCFSMSIANGSQWGNNFEVASSASMRDGMLDIAVMRKPHWYQIPMLLSYLRSKNQQANKLMSYIKTSEFVVHTESKKWHIDGEPIFIESPVEVKVNKSSLSILVPA